MSRKNLEMVERVLGQARDRPEALFEVLDHDVVWDVETLDIPDSPERYWHGPDGVREFFRRWVGPFDAWGYEVGELIEAGDSVVAEIHQWGRGKGSGASVESRFWQVWTIRAGKVVHASHHPERADALEAAGLSE